MADLKWQDTETGCKAKTGTGQYEIKGHDNQWGCLRNGALCGLFKDQDEAKGYADRLHNQLIGNPWLLKELT